MCHADSSTFLGEAPDARDYDGSVSALVYGDAMTGRKIAVLPDIYGTTSFYRAFSAYIAARGAEVLLVNPWQPFGDLPELTRDAAYERRHQLRDKAFCSQLEVFIERESIDTIIGFCIGGNFLLELVRNSFRGICCAVYPLPWGMPNDDAIDPAFDYLPDITHAVSILMGREDQLAGPDNIRRLEDVCAANPALDLHLYEASGHGFLRDLDSDNVLLHANARDALKRIVTYVMP